MKGLNKAQGNSLLCWTIPDTGCGGLQEGLYWHPKDGPGTGPHVRLQERTWYGDQEADRRV